MAAILKRKNILTFFFTDKQDLVTSINDVIFMQKFYQEKSFPTTGGFFAWALKCYRFYHDFSHFCVGETQVILLPLQWVQNA